MALAGPTAGLLTDPAAFERLLRLGVRQEDKINALLHQAGSDAVIRVMQDRAANQVILLTGNRYGGLRHILGRHLTGDLPGAYTTFFAEQNKVGDLVDIVAQTVRNGERVWDGKRREWVYTWQHETWGRIIVVVNDAGEVVSAYPQ